jgi:NTP pyrophosphatase (non-canonical NTP hydrolase)
LAFWLKNIPRETPNGKNQHAVNFKYNRISMDIKELTRAMHDFVNGKGWTEPDSPRPQTPKNLAVSLSIEAAEVLEHFQWDEKPPDPSRLAGELADVALYLLQLASVSGIDLENAIIEKLKVNAAREWDVEPAVKNEMDFGNNEN